MGFAGYSSDNSSSIACVIGFYTRDIFRQGCDICGYVGDDGSEVCGAGEKL